MAHPKPTPAHWVKIRWDGTPSGTLVCPWHGALPAATEYKPGIAPCGCEFVQLAGGVLRAIRQPADTVPAGLELQTDAQNAG